MSKIISASCLANVVSFDGLPIDATILSEGVKQSSGVALLEGDRATYITSNASDIKDLITNIDSVLAQVIVVLSALDAVSTSPGSTTAATAIVTTLKATLVAQKLVLK